MARGGSGRTGPSSSGRPGPSAGRGRPGRVVGDGVHEHPVDVGAGRHRVEQLHPQPLRCLTDPITLSQPTAALALGKSYLNCREDTALPQSLPWHPRLSERLGLFRYVEAGGSHEALFTDPEGFARGIERAGRD